MEKNNCSIQRDIKFYNVCQEKGTIGYILKKDSEVVLYGKGEYKGLVFKYHVVLDEENNELFVKIFDANPSKIILEIPDTINDFPVKEVNFISEDFTDSEGWKGYKTKKVAPYIEKIIIGKNVMFINQLYLHDDKLNEIVIKDGFSIDREGGSSYKPNLLYSIINNTYSSPKITSLDNRLIVEKDCVLSNDRKILYLALNRTNIIIPEGVEILKNYSLLGPVRKKFYSTYIVYDDFENAKMFIDDLNIKWPRSLKKIEDTALDVLNIYHQFPEKNWSAFTKYMFSTYPLPSGVECISECCLENFVKNDVLYVGDNINNITQKALNRIKEERTIRTIIPNSEYKFINKFLIDNNTNEIIDYLGDSNTSILYIPNGLNNLEKFFRENFAMEKKGRDKFDNIKNIVFEEYCKDFEDISHKVNQKCYYRKELINFIYKKELGYDDANSNNEITFNYENKACKLSNIIRCDLFDYKKLDIEFIINKKIKKFIISKECALIKELVIPEGFTHIEVDPECLCYDFEMEILSVPSTCKLNPLLTQLIDIKSLMLVIVNPPSKPSWKVHKLPYILACIGDYKMNKGSYTKINIDFEDGDRLLVNDEYINNEITYIKKFDRNKLIIEKDAYYYLDKKNGLSLLKVKDVEKYNIPKEIKGIPIVNKYDYCFSKYKGEV